jgi:hypothetical protein
MPGMTGERTVTAACKQEKEYAWRLWFTVLGRLAVLKMLKIGMLPRITLKEALCLRLGCKFTLQ